MRATGTFWPGTSENARAEWSLLRAGAIPSVELDLESMAAYAGKYGDPPFAATIRSDGDQLLIELPEAPAPFPLVGVSETRFYVDGIPQALRIRFVPGAGGIMTAIEVKQEGFAATFVRK